MQSENTARAEFAFHGKMTPHGLGDVFGKRQPQSGPMNLLPDNGGAAVKRLKHPSQLRFCNTNAAIPHGDLDLASAAQMGVSQESSHTDPATFPAVFYGIYDHVLQAAGQARSVPPDRRKGWFHFKLDVEPRGPDQARGLVDDRIDDSGHIQGTEGSVARAILRCGKQQYLIDELHHLTTLRLDGRSILS